MVKVKLELTRPQLDMLATICGFVDAGEVDGGPLDGISATERAMNLRAFRSLQDKASLAGMTLRRRQDALDKKARAM